MAEVTKTEEQQAEKSLDEDVEKAPHALESALGVGGEGNSSASGTDQSTENEKQVDSGQQDGRAKRKNLDSEDEPSKKVVSIICYELFSNPGFNALAQENFKNICARHVSQHETPSMEMFPREITGALAMLGFTEETEG